MANAFMGRFFQPNDKTQVQGGAAGTDPMQQDASAQASPKSRSEDEAVAAAEKAKSDLLSQRVDLHRFLLDRINLGYIDTMSSEELATEIRPIVRDYVRERHFPLSARELDLLIEDTTNEMLGLGPIEPLLKDDTIADILINSHKQIFIERLGQLELTDIQFKDEDHLLRVINKIVSAVGRRVDESTPLVDARLADGSRVNVAIRPVAVDGPMVSIRKFTRHPLTLDRLVQSGSMADAMRILLIAAVQGRMSIVVSGGTGSGKTTLLNALSSKISDKERLITIEDAAELQLQQTHVCRMETKPPTLDGRNELRQRELLKNALRMRPDRIIVGEVRGEEAFDMLQAMNTGHEGSMCTVHANSPRDAVSRLEQMVGMAGLPMTLMSIRGQIAAAIDLIVQVQRQHDGTRRVMSVSEITGMENDVIQMQEIMAFKKTGVNADNKVQGHYMATGLRPRFLETIAEVGLSVPDSIFDPSRPIN